MSGTMPDEIVNARSFDQRAGDYARYRPRYPDGLFDYLAALAPRRACALDVGTGNGQAAVALAARFDHVVATDPSPEQIAAAEQRPNIFYRVLAAEDTDAASGSLDLVVVAQALHWFALDRFYPAIERALAPAAVFAAFGYYEFQVAPDIDRVVQDAIMDPIAPYWARGNALLQRGYRDLPFPFDELEPPRFCIEMHWTLAELMGYLGTWSAVKRHAAEAPGSGPVLDRASGLLAPLWGAGARRVTMPIRLRVGRKRDAG
jgi:SAM-dependent methyltransferase